ncbi:MAG TPA: hypothetical protein VFA90_00105 [Terriglobales bacterium]|nr:hypothetical protein [Terriglobales bacterium]
MKAQVSSETKSFLDDMFGPDIKLSMDVAAFRAEIERLDKEIERESTEARTFEQRITKEDQLRAHGMSISLD